PAGTFALTITSAEQLSLKQGLSDNSRTVNISRTNYNGPVTLTAENLPTGVTATFANNPATANNAVLTLIAAVEAAVGTSTITIKGTGPASGTNPGLPPVVATATLQLAITTAGSF